VFKQGENEKTVTIQLGSIDGAATAGKGTDGEEDEEKEDVMFRVIIENPDPKIVKLSRKNVAFVTINQNEEGAAQDEHTKLIEFFMSSQKPTWGA